MECELAKAQLMPTLADSSSSVDIEAFLERHLKVRVDQYAPLPPEILGVTQFRSGQKPWLRINQDLTQTALDDEDRPDWALGRWRATLAHEASHVLLHAYLFASDPNQGSEVRPRDWTTWWPSLWYGGGPCLARASRHIPCP